MEKEREAEIAKLNDRFIPEHSINYPTHRNKKGKGRDMKKTALKVVERQDDHYELTGDEYSKFCDEFYDAMTMARAIRSLSWPNREEEIACDMDVFVLSGILLEKLKTIEPLLGK